MALQIRRGLEADRSSITPIQGELLYVTDTKNVYVGDGTTAGGTLVTGDVVNDTSPALGGNLNLNGNDITGTGNINITGTITATGNINLGDESADNVSVLGSITTSLTPRLDSAVDVGSVSNKWRNGFFNGLQVDGQIDALSVNARLIADDSTISYNPATNVFNGEFTGNITATGTLDGEMIGSVFGDDSTVLVDGINNILTANEVFTQSITALDSLTILAQDGFTTVNISSTEDAGVLVLNKISTSDLTGTSGSYGRVIFSRDDVNGNQVSSLIAGNDNQVLMGVSDAGSFASTARFAVWTGEYFGIGKLDPAQALDVSGNALISGSVTASTFDGDLTGSVFSDTSAMLIDGTDGKLMVANINVVGEVGNTPSTPGSVDSWLEVSVNGGTKYIPLYV